VFSTEVGAIVAGFGGIAAALMVVLMMPRMRIGSTCSFMRAIRRSRPPYELKGQNQQYEDN
jgi:hypothetical protein